MKKLYGSLLCKDCHEAITFLDKNNIKYEFINITESMANLREFLKIRDNRDEYNEVKMEGYVGIPLIIDENEKIYFLEDIYKIKEDN